MKESSVDVLIVGAGPAGLMAALWMSRLGIPTRIVDKNSEKLITGHADGLHPRSLETFHSFGIAEKVLERGTIFWENNRWGPNEKGHLARLQRLTDSFAGHGRYQSRSMHQGHVEGILQDQIKRYGGSEVERGVLPTAISINETELDDPSAFPATITLQHVVESEKPMRMPDSQETKDSTVPDGLSRSNLVVDDSEAVLTRAKEQGGECETVHAKYVIGCDGAHSWMRQQLGFKMEGERTDSIWGVVDIVPTTDFPDTRKICMMQTASGSILIIPREDRLTRFYIQLKEVHPEANGALSNSPPVSVSMILDTARKILAPYTLDYARCDWWSGYQVGQRVSNHFCDETRRIFLAGDAVHTHSPKAGQGMNVSMQDAHNLGWKIAGVLKSELPKTILSTYEAERMVVARQLIDFDHRLTKVFSGNPSAEQLTEIYLENMTHLMGYGSQYHTVLTAAGSKQHLATNTVLGKIFPSFQVVCDSSGQPFSFQQFLASDGRWRLLVFAGDLAKPPQKQRLDHLGHCLLKAGGLLPRYTKRLGSERDGHGDCMIEVLTLHASDRDAFEFMDLHRAFLPVTEEGVLMYEKVFVDVPSANDPKCGRAYEGYGVDKQRGCLVFVRPDQFVAWIGELEDLDELGEFCDGILLRQDGQNSTKTINLAHQ